MRSEEEEDCSRVWQAFVKITTLEMDTARDFEGLVDAKLYQLKQWAMRAYHQRVSSKPRCWPERWEEG